MLRWTRGWNRDGGLVRPGWQRWKRCDLSGIATFRFCIVRILFRFRKHPVVNMAGTNIDDPAPCVRIFSNPNRRLFCLFSRSCAVVAALVYVPQIFRSSCAYEK